MPLALPSVFTQIDLDSAALAGSATVVHQLKDTGDWRLKVCRSQDVVLSTVHLRVREDGTQLLAGVDLSEAEIAGQTRYVGDPVQELIVKKGGYLRLQASSGQGGLFGLLCGSKDEHVVWDSRQLVPSDLFAFLPIRPGSYLLTNLITPAECGITVTYPDPRTFLHRRMKNPDPVHIKVGTDFPVNKMKVVPGQGIVLEVGVAARFRFRLETPDDGPADLAAWRKAQDESALAALIKRHKRN